MKYVAIKHIAVFAALVVSSAANSGSKNMGANTGRRRVLPRRDTLRFLLALAGEQRAGNILAIKLG